MRWLGRARRAHDVALAYARKRQAFGKSLGEHEGVGFMIADNELDLHSARLSIWHTAWTLDQGAKGNLKSSISKVFVSEAAWRIVDRCVQILGGQGSRPKPSSCASFGTCVDFVSTTAPAKCIAGASPRKSSLGVADSWLRTSSTDCSI
jgi:hypothetical protein